MRSEMRCGSRVRCTNPIPNGPMQEVRLPAMCVWIRDNALPPPGFRSHRSQKPRSPDWNQG
jgi:hypothetical protein